jgi:hypothetical protein
LTMVKKSSTANIVGISQGDASASSTKDIVARPLMDGMEFVGNIIHGTASSALVPAVGTVVYLAKVTSGDTNWGFSIDAPGASSASYVRGKVTGLIDAASTANGRVLATFTSGGLLRG